MAWAQEELEVILENALLSLQPQRGEDNLLTLRSIISTNLERKRVQYYLQNDSSAQPYDYVQRVVEHYDHWHPYIHQIQVEKQTAVWQPLFAKLQMWAYTFLRRYLSDPDHLHQQSQNCATEAASILVNAHFPYDVDFDPWACVLLQNVCRKYIAQTAKNQYPDKELVSLDRWDDWLRNIADPASGETKRRTDLRLDLLSAIEQLATAARQEFILRYYFEGQTYEQIAQEMNRSKNALYKLHFDALENLRKIMAPNEDRYE